MAGSERAEPSIFEEIEEVRETILEYDARLDRSGSRWEELRIRLDVRLRMIGARVKEDTKFDLDMPHLVYPSSPP